MMLPGPRLLLLRAVLLLSAACCSPAAADGDWSAESRPHRPAKAWGKAAAGTPATPDDVAAAGREGLMMGFFRLPSSELYPGDPEELQIRRRDPSQTASDLQRTETKHSWEPSRTGTDPPSEPTGTDPPSQPNRTGTDPPSQPNRTGTDPPSQPNRTGTDPPSEPNRTGTDPPSQPNRTGTDPPSQPNRTGTDPPSQPNRTGTDPPSQPNRTGTDPPSEPNRTGTDPPSQPNRTGTDPPSQPNRTGTDPPSQPNRTGTDPPSQPNRTNSPSEPNRSGTDPPSEPNRIMSDPLSEPNKTRSDPPSEFSRTGTDSPSKPNGTDLTSEFSRTTTDSPSDPKRIGTNPSSELSRTRTDPPSEPSRTGTDPPSEPNRIGSDPPSTLSRTGTDPPSEPNRIRSDPPSEPSRTGTNPPSEPNRIRSDPPSEPSRTGTNPPSDPDRTETDPRSEPNRFQMDPTSEPNRTKTNSPSEPNRTDHPPNTDIEMTQTLADPGQREHHPGPHIYYRSDPDWTEMYAGQTSSAAGSTQRHLNKRTPHMDTTYTSTTRGGDRTLLSISNDTSVADITEIPSTYPTNSTGGNITEDTPAVRNTSSEGAVPATYPLQTPSYVVTTYPSPTSHHMPNATSPFKGVPVTTPNVRGIPMATEGTPNNSSADLWSSSPPELSTMRSSSSGWTSATAATTNMATSSSSPLGEVTSPSQQPPSHVSSSPSIPSTFVAVARPSVSPSMTEASSNAETTRAPHLLTAMSSTAEALASSTSLPPFLNMESTPGTETNKTLVSSISPTDQTSTAKIVSTSFSPETPLVVVTERRSRDEVIPATQEITTTLMPMGAETTMTSTEGTPGVTVGARVIGTFTQTRDNALSTTSTMPTPSPRDTVKLMGSGHPTLTSKETTQADPNTVAPRVDYTVSTKGKKTLPDPLPPRTTPAVKSVATTVLTPPRTTPTVAASPCSSSPCHNGGLCVDSRDLKSYTCDCPAAWSGDLCSTDVDECLSSPCPAPSSCLNTRGSFSCQCPIGYLLQKGAGCVLVRTFLGHIEIPWSFLDGSDMKDSRLHQIKEDIVRIMNSSFSAIPGYYQSIVSSDSSDNLIVQNQFSLESNVTLYDLSRSLQNYGKVCETSPERPSSCQLVVHLQHRIRVLSLCLVRDPGCDNATAVCADPAGLALCQCKAGFYKYSKADHSCRACDDGYKLESEACVRCPFGLGGFNCSNPYQLITVIIAAGGGGLLLILVIALAVTCCRKNKHDISKLIFKSGDFQMSPYAEYPKTQRSSEWGREAIEMQENGSTKNLLQMTDIYYSPGLRNAEMERNGLYPYNGLPGSRHSCIYPGQYNPSFITEENRRRDYF